MVAGLLHDVLEDTDVAPEEVQARFGPEVARIVRALTQDPAIEDYAERKAALRRQTINAGRGAATIALADKVAKLQASTGPAEEAQAAPLRGDAPGGRGSVRPQPAQGARARAARPLAAAVSSAVRRRGSAGSPRGCRATAACPSTRRRGRARCPR